jgi:hypothetical protein
MPTHRPAEEPTDRRSRGARVKARLAYWLDSDLVGIPATVYTFAVLAISLLVFRFGGGVAGMIVAVALWIPMVVFAIRGVGKPPARLDEGPRHRVLVIANRGLEDPALCAEVCRRTDRTATQAMILVPVFASSRLAELADDVDEEMAAAQRHLDFALRGLRREGVEAGGRVDISQPMESLRDGLREFPPNEILMLPDNEVQWEGASALADRVRAEVGLPVTTVGPSVAAAGRVPG